jgi:hypothetical protein
MTACQGTTIHPGAGSDRLARVWQGKEEQGMRALRHMITPLLLVSAVSLSVLGTSGAGAADAATISPGTHGTSVQTPGPLTPVLTSSHETQTAESNGKRCYSAYAHLDWKGAAGFTTYTTWLGIKWCSRHKRVISSRIYVRGGETQTPLWSYDGKKGKGTRNVGWEVRVYSEVEFSYGIGPYHTHEFPCTQIRARANGHWSVRRNCNLS